MKLTIRNVTVLMLTVLLFFWLYVDRLGVLSWYLLGLIAVYLLSQYSNLRNYILIPIVILPLFFVKLKANFILGFIGISFITFRCIDFLLTKHDRRDQSMVEFLIYIFFPPLILAGPMYRYRDFQRDLKSFDFNVAKLIKAFEYIGWGLIYKFLISEIIKDYGLSEELSDFWILLVDAVFYSIYLFFDFAGYSKIAIGIGLFFGFVLPENFKAPFLAKNPSDFWQRWHISLSSWLRDVVFMPLAGSLMKIGYFRRNYFVAVCLASFVTLILMGIWNGLEWKYVASGAMFGCYSVFYLTMNHWKDKSKLIKFGFENLVVVSIFRILHIVGCVVALYVFSGRWEGMQ